MERARAWWRALSSGPAVAVLLLVLAATPTSAIQTEPDPFGGDGIHTDLRAGSTGQDIGDVFLLREGDSFQVEILLEDTTPPTSFIESHVCLSADGLHLPRAPGSVPVRRDRFSLRQLRHHPATVAVPHRDHVVHRSARPLLRADPCRL